jgi:hypothetical protein
LDAGADLGDGVHLLVHGHVAEADALERDGGGEPADAGADDGNAEVGQRGLDVVLVDDKVNGGSWPHEERLVRLMDEPWLA